MKLNYDHQKLHKLFQDFYRVTGLSINMRDTDFRMLVSKEQEGSQAFCSIIRTNETTLKCCDDFDKALFERARKSRKMEIAVCHAGLVDVAVPLFYHDTVLGYITFGQMKRDADFSSVCQRIANYPLDIKQMELCYNRLPLFDQDKIESIANIAAILAEHILLENILHPAMDPNIEKAIAYIDENIDKDLSLKTIVQNVHVSKSSLYRGFQAHFNCAVNEYILKRKIDKSIEMLCDSELSVGEIAQKLGFSYAANYTRTFKKMKGIRPSDFRKQQNSGSLTLTQNSV